MEAALGLRELGGDDLEIALVSSGRELLHQPVAHAPWTLGGVRRHPLAYVAELLGATLVLDELVEVDADAGAAVLRQGGRLEYDALLLAIGARRVMSLDGAVAFGSPLDVPAVEGVIDLARHGELASLAVTVPPAAAWTLPAYEVALRAADCGAKATIVTPESKPASVFGDRGAEAVAAALAAAGVELVHGTVREAEPGMVFLTDDRPVRAEAVVALPYVRGPRVAGLPHDDDGFLPVDPFAAVAGVEGVYAAGDATTFPIRQGGLACQQAAVAAGSITGAREPLKPVVRGALPIRDGTLWLMHDLASGEERASYEPLWDPPHRIAGVRLPAFLERLDAES